MEKVKKAPVDWASEPLYIWKSESADCPHQYLSKYRLGETFPIFFVGDTHDEAVKKAEVFRHNTINREATILATRRASAAKARVGRGRKKKADTPPAISSGGNLTGTLKNPRGRRPKIITDAI